MSELAIQPYAVRSSDADGRSAEPHPLLRELLRAVADVAPGLEPGEVLLVRTERHLVGKYAFLRDSDLRTLDLFEYREAGQRSLRSRFVAARAARAELIRLRDAGALRGVRAMLFDVSEAWFATSLFHTVRELLPSIAILGVQHGVMELSGMEGATLVRRLRLVATRVQHALLRCALVGGGFGNAPFDAYVCYGATYRRYIHRVQPRTRVLVNFGDLTPADRGASAERELPFDILVLSQDLSAYGVADQSAVYRSVFRRIDQVSRARGLRVRVKMHPKQELEAGLVAEFPRFEFVRQGPLHEMLSGRLRAVVSFNSTGLLEAAAVGAPVVAIRVPSVHMKWYDPFEATVDLDAFRASWDLGVTSRVRAGEME